MIEQGNFKIEHLERYRPLVGDKLLDEIYDLAADLKGVRIAHINATATGGGVAEILSSVIPLYRDLGIHTSWFVLQGDASFFTVTKQLHNSLQGGNCPPSTSSMDIHRLWNQRNADLFQSQFDVVFVHDPQPALISTFAHKRSHYWVWRCHIDTSSPDAETWQYLCGIVDQYDATIFSMPAFIAPGFNNNQISIIPPAIDPFTPKNQVMPKQKALKVVAQFGVDVTRPFVSQISRFDPWKDPLGVLASFELLKQDNPDLQLALLGNFASDDPEGHVIYQQVVEASKGINDVHIITDLTDLVGPFQSHSKVVIQKSIREGFGLTATEAMWKRTPVVAGNVGGLKHQISDGEGGFLVNSIEECAQRVDYLLRNEKARLAAGKAGQTRVKNDFLMPRLLRDELRVTHDLLKKDSPAY